MSKVEREDENQSAEVNRALIESKHVRVNIHGDDNGGNAVGGPSRGGERDSSGEEIIYRRLTIGATPSIQKIGPTGGILPLVETSRCAVQSRGSPRLREP